MSDPRLFLGGDRSESDPLPPCTLFLGGDRSASESCLVLERLRGGDRSGTGTRPADDDLDISLCEESVCRHSMFYRFINYQSLKGGMKMRDFYVPL